jgi:hypothetical protein
LGKTILYGKIVKKFENLFGGKMNLLLTVIVLVLYVVIHGLGWVKPRVEIGSTTTTFHHGWQMWVIAPLASMIRGVYHLAIGAAMAIPLLVILLFWLTK